MREYGRYVQKMVEHILTIEDLNAASAMRRRQELMGF
jgi:hypothetical protein